MGRMGVLWGSMVTTRGAWRANIASLRENTTVGDGIEIVEGSAWPYG